MTISIQMNYISIKLKMSSLVRQHISSAQWPHVCRGYHSGQIPEHFHHCRGFCLDSTGKTSMSPPKSPPRKKKNQTEPPHLAAPGWDVQGQRKAVIWSHPRELLSTPANMEFLTQASSATSPEGLFSFPPSSQPWMGCLPSAQLHSAALRLSRRVQVQEECVC